MNKNKLKSQVCRKNYFPKLILSLISKLNYFPNAFLCVCHSLKFVTGTFPNLIVFTYFLLHLLLLMISLRA